MKTTIKTLATMFLILVTSAVFSMDPPDKKNVQLLPAEQGKIKVLYVNPKAENVTIKIRNINGVLHTEKIKMEEDGFIVRYDLSDVKCQDLSIEVTDEDTSTRFRIEKDPIAGSLYATYWAQPSNSSQLVASN
jgi:hypothetical protein